MTSVLYSTLQFGVDWDSLAREPACLPHFSNILACASDGSDHRHCCSQVLGCRVRLYCTVLQGGVEAGCLDWCRGEQVVDTEACAVSYSQTIVSCFHQGATRFALQTLL